MIRFKLSQMKSENTPNCKKTIYVLGLLGKVSSGKINVKKKLIWPVIGSTAFNAYCICS